MIELQQAIEDIQAQQLSVIDFTSPQWQVFTQANGALFGKVQTAKPEQSIKLQLLGVLTKAHIETLARVTNHVESVKAMRDALNQGLGQQHAENFHYQDGEQLLLVTHLWLYLQGYLSMDFSLANDHANQSALVLSSAIGGDSQQLRSEFMASFYLGKQSSPKQTPLSLLAKLKQFFR